MPKHTNHIDMRISGWHRNQAQFRFVREGADWRNRLINWHDVTDATAERILRVVNEWNGVRGDLKATNEGWEFHRYSEQVLRLKYGENWRIYR